MEQRRVVSIWSDRAHRLDVTLGVFTEKKLDVGVCHSRKENGFADRSDITKLIQCKNICTTGSDFAFLERLFAPLFYGAFQGLQSLDGNRVDLKGLSLFRK